MTISLLPFQLMKLRVEQDERTLSSLVPNVLLCASILDSLLADLEHKEKQMSLLEEEKESLQVRDQNHESFLQARERERIELAEIILEATQARGGAAEFTEIESHDEMCRGVRFLASFRPVRRNMWELGFFL